MSAPQELTDEERDNVEADVYARCMIDLAKEHPRAEGIAGKTDTLIGGVASLTISLQARPTVAGFGRARVDNPVYVAKAGPEVKRPRSFLLAQIVAALAHDVGGCDCKDPTPIVGQQHEGPIDARYVVCPAATEVIARCKVQISDRLAAALVIKSISVFAKP